MQFECWPFYVEILQIILTMYIEQDSASSHIKTSYNLWIYAWDLLNDRDFNSEFKEFLTPYQIYHEQHQSRDSEFT